MEKFDITVIGGGPGGYPAAIRAAQLGATVALIEKEFLGGTCLNWGCIPTKTLIAASSMFRAMRKAKGMGISVEKICFDYPSMIRNKNQVVDRLRSGVAKLLESNGVKVFEGTGAFVSRNRVAVKKSRGNACRIETGHTIVATGSVPALPEFLPKNKAILDSRSFLDHTTLPGDMIVLGGGIIGCELACMAAQLGVKITLVEILDDILTTLDTDLRAEVLRHMEHQLKIRILTGNPLDHVTVGSRGIRGEVNRETVESELLLAAVGRRPVTKDLVLEKAGAKTNEHGYIAVDEQCQTSAASVYAIGDVIGGPQLAHAATAQGLMVAETIMGHRRHGSSRVIPSCIFTALEIGTAGLSEQEAREQNREVTIGKFSFAASGKAVASGETTGFAKWIVDSSTDQLVGAQVIGPHAAELIAEATLAIQTECTASELARTVHAHPTLSEAWMEAANAVHGQCIHAIPRK